MEDTRLDVARDGAWKHFELHAKQRIDVFRAFLTLIGFVFGGYGVAFQTRLYPIGAALAVYGLALCWLFWRLDVRTSSMVKLSEDYLISDQERLSVAVGSDRIEIFRRSQARSDSFLGQILGESYSEIFSRFFILTAALSFAVLIGSIVLICA